MEPSEGTHGGGAKKPKAPSASPVAALSDDLLRQILFRLPDMASLANAALAEKRWYAVASDPAVFRRFDSLRRPLLLGFILTDRGDQYFPGRCSNLRFVRATRGYPNLASVAAGADFFFEDLSDDDSDDEEERYSSDVDWRLRGCAGGRLLLSRGYNGLRLAVYDPIARTAVFLHPSTVFHSIHRVRYAISVDEADGSFLVIGVVDFNAAVFSSRSGKWVKFEGDDFIERSGTMDDDWDWSDLDEDDIYEFPGGGIMSRRRFEEQDTIDSIYKIQADGMAAGRFAYWRSDTKNSGKWILKKEFSLLNEQMKKLRREEWMKRVRILAARATYVYMEYWSIRKSHSYLLVFHLTTRKLTFLV
nr:unnamed protein product [Digitaria exilis]